jgi:hypothetical protein
MQIDIVNPVVTHLLDRLVSTKEDLQSEIIGVARINGVIYSILNDDYYKDDYHYFCIRFDFMLNLTCIKVNKTSIRYTPYVFNELVNHKKLISNVTTAIKLFRHSTS